jgi:hypothetical protein
MLGKSKVPSAGAHRQVNSTTPTWQELALLSNESLSRRDVAVSNLACAVGLPGADRFDSYACVCRLDEFAAFVKPYTDSCLVEFLADPAHYNGSEGIFRVACLTTALGRKFGVRYNPAKVPIDVPMDAADSFIGGALLGDGGSCGSLPVVCAAVGRRLGYPIRLSTAFRHLFARWEDPQTGERFNIEYGDKGMDAPPDEHYRQGRMEAPPLYEELGCFRQTLTPRQELGCFLTTRAYLLKELGRTREECEALIWASTLHPENLMYQEFVKTALHVWKQKLEAQLPPAFPQLFADPPERRFPAFIPDWVERKFHILAQLEERLRDPDSTRYWWNPLLQDKAPSSCQVVSWSK